MADVAATGTAANQGLPSGTYAKRRTAEYGAGAFLPADAWLIGFNGDIAVAALVVDDGNGGPTCGPIVARFLDALGSLTWETQSAMGDSGLACLFREDRPARRNAARHDLRSLW